MNKRGIASAWKKKGLIFCPDKQFDWMQNYATIPTVAALDEGTLRVYFGTRDALNRNSIGFVDVAADQPEHVLHVHHSPVLRPGRPGTFDDCGVMPSCVVDVNDEKWMYYIGWNVRNTIPYYNSIGLAISRDGGLTFERFSEGPLFDRNYKEPHFCAAPYVLVEDGLWRMWYLSTTAWVEYEGKMEPRYHIKYAESDNGIDWRREGLVAIDYKDESEAGIVRASVLKDDGSGLYRMWFSYRGLIGYRTNRENSYRIGYAESQDGIDWERMDEMAGIDVSDAGWDSQMIEYPFVVQRNNRLLMFYNGNTFGESGFGYAVADA